MKTYLVTFHTTLGTYETHRLRLSSETFPAWNERIDRGETITIDAGASHYVVFNTRHLLGYTFTEAESE